MATYPQLRLELNINTGSYTAMNDNVIVFQSPSNIEVFEWARERADVLILGRRFKVPLLKRRED